MPTPTFRPWSTSDTIGKIDAPPGVDKQIVHFGGSASDVAILFFFNKLVTIFIVVVSILVIFNIVTAAFTFITNQGDSSSHSKAREKITMSFVGLFIIVLAYLGTAIIGLMFFGDAQYILNPTIQGPT